MAAKESYRMSGNLSESFATTQERGRAAEHERQIQAPSADKTNPSIWLRPSPEKPRVLIVHDDDVISQHLEIVLHHAGLPAECVKSMKAACEYARTGRFQVIVTTPILRDGSWKLLADVDSHNRPGFVIILVAITFDLNEWSQALKDGAFDVLDALHEIPNVADAARRALWAAYLKGAGPRPEAPNAVSVA